MYNPIKPFKKQILKEIEKTWRTPYVRVRRGIYPVITREPRGDKVDHTDGLGTKGVYHWQAGIWRAAAIDAMAMNLNDLAMSGARCYKLQNHITVPVEDKRVFEILRAIVTECRKRKIAVTGGENSFHNNADGLDISVTVSGFVETGRSENKIKPGEVLIGIASSGLHSNGFSLVRKVFGKKLRPEFVVPTAIYSDALLEALKHSPISGMMHITGGAWSKLRDIIGKCDLVIDKPLAPQKIFRDLYAKVKNDKVMYTTLNCGTGFVLSISPVQAIKVLTILSKHHLKAKLIGRAVRGHGQIVITSAFTDKEVLV